MDIIESLPILMVGIDNMKRFFNWVKRVIVGWYNVIFNHMSDEAKARYEICLQCEDKIKIGKDYWCTICGCNCKAKSASPEEKCLNGKW